MHGMHQGEAFAQVELPWILGVLEKGRVHTRVFADALLQAHLRSQRKTIIQCSFHCFKQLYTQSWIIQGALLPRKLADPAEAASRGNRQNSAARENERR